MKERLERERIYLCSPYAVSVTRVEIEGVLFIEKLREAVACAVRRNELLNVRVVLEENGEAYYETQVFDDNPNETIKICEDIYWKDLVREQEQLAFDLDHGELVRFFLLQNEEKQELVVMAHRLLGDGASIAFLIEDIMRGLTGQAVLAKPYKRQRLEDEKKRSFFDKMKEKHIRSSWQKEGTVFCQEEYDRLQEEFRRKNTSYVSYETFYTPALLKIASFAKKENVSIGTAVLTAFAKASRELRHVQAEETTEEKLRRRNEKADRKELQKQLQPEPLFLEISSSREYKGIGEYAVTKSERYLYEEELSFAENAKRLENIIKQAESGKEAKLLARFPGSMTDSIFFELSGLYVNPDTEWLIRELDYENRTAGIAATNLAKVPIPVKYKSLTLKNYVYVPPLHQGARRALGIAVLGNVMNICLHVKRDEYIGNARLFFQKGIETLRKL